MRRIMERFSTRTLMRFSLMAVAASAIAACGGGSDGPTPPTPVSVAGTWNMQTVNGSPLPHLSAGSGNNKIELTADVLTVSSGGSFTDTQTYRTTENGSSTTLSEPFAGTYVLNGSTVTFRYNSGGSRTGTVSRDTLTVANGPLSYVFRKQ